MDKETLIKLAENIEKNLAKYQELSIQRTMLEERLSKAEKQRDSVNDRVFQKVCEEYQHQLTKLAKELAPLEADVEEARKAFPDELQQIEALTGQLEEKVEEFDFRHRVGEYSESEFANMATPLREQAGKLAKRGEWLTQILRQVEDVLKATDQGDSSEPTPTARKETTRKGEPAAEKTGKDAETAPAVDTEASEPSTAAEPVSKMDKKEESVAEASAEKEAEIAKTGPARKNAKESNLIDPSEWMDEILEDVKAQKTSSKTGRAQADAPTARPDKTPAPAVKDSVANTNATSDAKTAAVGTEEAPRSFPVLIITKGPGSGKKLPLVPMTMTLGREHDNNIELKDEDVARYHARISFKKGDYVLEDLASASGTWVNDEKVTETALKHGDKIRVGGTEMLIDFE